MLINFNSPYVAFAITAVIIYTGKIVEHGSKAKIDKTKEDKEKEVKKEREKTTTSDGKPASKSFMNVVKDTVIPNAGSTGTLRAWDETDLEKVKKKRKRGPDDAKKWIEDNWEKVGGVI